MEGTLTECQVFVIATKLASNNLLAGLPDKQHMILLLRPPS